MAENTKIAWATHSFSPWIGCSHVHTGCANCYAEAMHRLGVTWGPKGTRRRTADSTWRQVERWNRKAADACCSICRGQGHGGDPTRPCRYCRGTGNATGESDPRVFPSLCDPFEDWNGPILDSAGNTLYRRYMGPARTGTRSECDGQPNAPLSMDDVRRDFFALIDRCQNLDFLLLTKRPENVRRMWTPTPGLNPKHPGTLEEAEECIYRDNCWLLYSASDQATLDAGLTHLMACRDLAPVVGISLEPLVGPIDLGTAHMRACPYGGQGKHVCDSVDWVIVGGESGPHARPCSVEWIRSIVEQCREAGVPCYVKQLGSNACDERRPLCGQDCEARRKSEFRAINDPKGGDPYEWPEDLRVREFPR